MRGKEDLLKAIRENFQPADISSMPKDERDNQHYEKAMCSKASSFVGRTVIADRIFRHCEEKEVDNNVMIVAGEPGAGKSVLMWAKNVVTSFVLLMILLYFSMLWTLILAQQIWNRCFSDYKKILTHF